MTQQSQTARPMAAVLVASHAIDDLYQGAVPALVPFLVAERHYGYVAASGITLAATLLSSVAAAHADPGSNPQVSKVSKVCRHQRYVRI